MNLDWRGVSDYDHLCVYVFDWKNGRAVFCDRVNGHNGPHLLRPDNTSTKQAEIDDANYSDYGAAMQG